MGILKDLFGLGDDKKESRSEKSERIWVDDHGNTKIVYDGDDHWKEDLRWDPESGRWDKLDFSGNVTGSVDRDWKNDLTRQFYVEEEKKTGGSGLVGFLESLQNDAVEFNRKMEEISRKNNTDL